MDPKGQKGAQVARGRRAQRLHLRSVSVTVQSNRPGWGPPSLGQQLE